VALNDDDPHMGQRARSTSWRFCQWREAKPWLLAHVDQETSSVVGEEPITAKRTLPA
jgi:hypothetical protein